MAISGAQLRMCHLGGTPIPAGVLHAVFGAGVIGAATGYAWLEVRNTHPTLTLSECKAWLVFGSGGAIALAYGSAPIPADQDWPSIDVTALTYSSPATQAAGISVANLPAGYKVLLAMRRTLTSAAEAKPQTGRPYLGGTSPL